MLHLWCEWPLQPCPLKGKGKGKGSKSKNFSQARQHAGGGKGGHWPFWGTTAYDGGWLDDDWGADEDWNDNGWEAQEAQGEVSDEGACAAEAHAAGLELGALWSLGTSMEELELAVP